MAERTVVPWLQVVLGIAVREEERTTLLGKILNCPVGVEIAALRITQEKEGLSDRYGGYLGIDLGETWDLRVDLRFSAVQIATTFQLLLAVDTHNSIIL